MCKSPVAEISLKVTRQLAADLLTRGKVSSVSWVHPIGTMNPSITFNRNFHNYNYSTSNVSHVVVVEEDFLEVCVTRTALSTSPQSDPPQA